MAADIHARQGPLARRQALLLALVLLLAATWPALGHAQPVAAREAMLEVPVVGLDGVIQMIRMRFCQPETGGPAPLVLVNHGLPRETADRVTYALAPCDHEAIRWFLARGFAVGQPLRRGYGISGGPWAEAFSCSMPEFTTMARESARDIAAALALARTLPGVDAARPAVVLGVSAGGWGALALASQNPQGVGAMVNMAGGVGGRVQRVPDSNCRLDLLGEGASSFGSTARVPMIWVYAANDSFFRPSIAAAMHRLFVAGGGVAELHQLDPWGEDGHALFFGRRGSDIWGPLLEDFLSRHGAMP